jgi:hypothetical protein
MTINRTSVIHGLLCLLLGYCASCSKNGAPSPFVGDWCNKDFETQGVTRVHIQQKGTKLIAHMWGRCYPTECDWGKAIGATEEGSKVLPLAWKMDFMIETQKLTVLVDGGLELVSHTHFTDKSGRPDYDSKYTFAKGLAHDWNYPPNPN